MAGVLVLLTCCAPKREEVEMRERKNEQGRGSFYPGSCVESLQKLCEGELTGWHGFHSSCSRDDVTKALGAGKNEEPMYGNLGGSPAIYFQYSNITASPYEVTVWYIDGRAVALEMHTVTIQPPFAEQLGEPEAKDISRMPGFKTMWIYASRGLTLHVDDHTGKIAWLYAFHPMTLEEFRNSWLSKVEIRRHQVR